jgi:hypothetical protein
VVEGFRVLNRLCKSAQLGRLRLSTLYNKCLFKAHDEARAQSAPNRRSVRQAEAAPLGAAVPAGQSNVFPVHHSTTLPLHHSTS